jgi:RimJ/RimL family protein N-acetyltransferase
MAVQHLKNGEMMIVREAHENDAPEILAYVRQIGDETDYLTFNSEEFNKTLDEEIDIINRHKLAENQIFLVAEIEGTIIGILNVAASPRRRLRHVGEFALSVAKAHWNKGVGATLMKYMLNWAKHNAIIRKINLRVHEDNKSAIELYKKFGFENEGRLRIDFFLNGKFSDAILMGLIIDEL